MPRSLKVRESRPSSWTLEWMNCGGGVWKSRQRWERSGRYSARSEGFRDLYEKRRPYYLKARLRQETHGKTVEAVAAELIQALQLASGGGKRGENE